MANAPVVGVTAITGSNVEHFVRAKADPVTVVVELGPTDRSQTTCRRYVRHVFIAFGHGVLFDHVAVVVPKHLAQIRLVVQVGRVSHIELAIALEIGVESQTQQATLVKVCHQWNDFATDVEECSSDLTVFKNLDTAVLLSDEQAVIAWRLHHGKRCVDATDNFFQCDAWASMCC